MRTSRWGSKTILTELLESSSSESRLSKLSTNLKTPDTMASDAEEIVNIENISGIRYFSLDNNETNFKLLLIARKQENSELGFSLLAPSCLKPAINGFKAAKKRSQNSHPKS